MVHSNKTVIPMNKNHTSEPSMMMTGNHTPKPFTEDDELHRNTTLTVDILISSLIIIVNFCVVLLFVTKSKLRKSSSNKILFSLVISDLVTGFTMVPYCIVALNKNLLKPSTSSEFAFRIVLDIITTSIQLATMGNLNMIIIERYIALMFPYKIEKCLNKRRVTFAILTVWVTAFFIPSTQMIWLYKVIRGDMTVDEKDLVQQADTMFSVITIFFFGLLPVVIIFIMFVCMFKQIRAFPENDPFKKRKEELRVLIIFCTMYVLYLIFSVPYFSIRLLVDLNHENYYKIPYTIRLIVNTMKSMPPLINPFVYVLNKPDIKRVLRLKARFSIPLTNRISIRTLTSLSRNTNSDHMQKLITIIRDAQNNNNSSSDELTTEVPHKHPEVSFKHPDTLQTQTEQRTSFLTARD